MVKHLVSGSLVKAVAQGRKVMTTVQLLMTPATLVVEAGILATKSWVILATAGGIVLSLVARMVKTAGKLFQEIFPAHMSIEISAVGSNWLAYPT